MGDHDGEMEMVRIGPARSLRGSELKQPSDSAAGEQLDSMVEHRLQSEMVDLDEVSTDSDFESGC
jgi:hypothetical protein